MLIAQISDPHITSPGETGFHGGDAVAAVDRCVDRLLSLPRQPDAVLGTGDLTADGEPAEYAALRERLDRLPMPVYLVPGNHDRRGPLREAFAHHGYWPAEGDFLHYAVDAHPLRLIGLDTVIPGATGGLMCAARIDWLDRCLGAAPDRPTLVFMHHPPARTGIAAMDAMRCEGGEAMAEVVGRHPQVVRVVCGHVHRAISLGWAGTTLCIAPSVTAQLELDLAGRGKAAWSRIEPGAFLLHHWDADRGLATHVAAIPS